MPKRSPLTILSVDFDYFLVYKDPRAVYYCPDSGNELDASEMTISWASHYAEAASKNFDLLNNIIIDETQVRRVKKYIERQDDPFCMVADSHLHIFDFIQQTRTRIPDRSDDVVIYNIDLHHDTHPRSKTTPLHCGNWLSKLLDAHFVTEAHWISAPDSNIELMDPRCKRDMTLQDLEGIKFDSVFVCRSGSWVPPHLDAHFIKYFAKPLAQNKRGWECRYQPDILENRYSNKEFKQLVTKVTDMLAGKIDGFVYP